MTHSTALDDLLAHASWAHSLARRLVEDQAAADDVVQELWLAALRRPPATGRPVRPWIASVVRRLAQRRRRNELRRQQREQTVARDERSPDAAESVARAEGQRLLVEAVMALEEPFRSTVLQRYFDGAEPAAIAAASGEPAGTVRWRLAKARELLRARLDADHGGDHRRWCRALVPLAAWGTPRRAVLLTPALGGLLTMKALLQATALLVLALLAWIGSQTIGSVHSVPTPMQTAAVEDGPDAAPGAAEPAPPTTRTATAAADPAPAGPAAEATAPAIGSARNAATILLRCVSPDGLPRANVAVDLSFLDKPTVRTDEDGRARRVVNLERRIPPDPTAAERISLLLTGDGLATTMVGALVRPGQTIELGDVVVLLGATVRGRVVDAAGEPVAGATVTTPGRTRRVSLGGGMFTDSDDGAGHVRTTSDATGRFTLAGALLGRQQLRASLGNRNTERWLEGDADIEIPATGRDDVVLRIVPPMDDSTAIRIVVLDPDGHPVPRANLRLQGGSGMASSAADEQGRKLFRPQGRGPFSLTARHPDDRYPPARATDVAAGDRVELRFAPGRSATIQFAFGRRPPPGEVRLQLSTPPSSMLQRLLGSRPQESLGNQEITVDAEGRADFRLPAEPFVIKVLAAGHQPLTTATLVPDRLPAPLPLTLAAARQVHGRVVDPAGAPVAGAAVELYLHNAGRTTVDGFPTWLDRETAAATRSDGRGRFALDWTEDREARVRVRSDDGLLAETGGRLPGHGDTTVEVVVRAAGSLTGRVFGSRDPAGTIVACSRGDGRARSTRTASDGSYRFDDLLPGAYRVVLRQEEIDPSGYTSEVTLGSAHREVPTDVLVTSGETAVHDLRDGDAGRATLELHLQLPGRQLAGLQVEVVATGSPPGTGARSQAQGNLDAAGRASLVGLASGPHRVLLRHASLLVDARVDLRDGSNQLQVAVTATGSVQVAGVPETAARTFLGGAVFVCCELPGATLRFPVHDAGSTRLDGIPAGAARLERGPTEQELRSALSAGEADVFDKLVVLRRFTVEPDRLVRVDF